ncbi:MAG: polysaccharide pyruvyl transferase family protein [Thermoguttaceae bacterium]|nr:polysaccharide pyruvyl transferase family protein [Thermoguttaceae bacterium]
MAVVAGSPEWTTRRCYNFFEHVVKNATPVVILGVGSLEASPPPFVREVAKKARFFSVRSEDLLVDRDWARDAGAVYLPCPALLAADEKNERKIDAVRRIALVYSAPERDSIRANSVANEVADAILALYRRLLETRSERVEFFGVCHYIDELPGATRFFGEFGVPVFYSYDAADYEEIYGRADLTVSARVHACGLSASLGVPGVFFGTDARAGTCRGFLSEFLDYRVDYRDFERKIDRIAEEIAPRNAERSTLTSPRSTVSPWPKRLTTARRRRKSRKRSAVASKRSTQSAALVASTRRSRPFGTTFIIVIASSASR